jgi:hypothetical protein
MALAAARAAAEGAGLQRIELRPAAAGRIDEPQIVTFLPQQMKS